MRPSCSVLIRRDAADASGRVDCRAPGAQVEIRATRVDQQRIPGTRVLILSENTLPGAKARHDVLPAPVGIGQ